MALVKSSVLASFEGIKRKMAKDRKIESLLKGRRWVKRSGLYLPQNNRTSVEPTALEKSVKLYITYDDIFKGTKFEKNTDEIILTHLREFDYYNVLDVLGRLNYLLSDKSNIIDSEELLILKSIFSEDIYKKLEILWRNERKLLPRQLILTAMKMNIIYNDPVPGRKLAKDDKEGFGRLLFRFTDMLADKYPKKQEVQLDEKDKNKSDAYLKLKNAIDPLAAQSYRLKKKEVAADSNIVKQITDSVFLKISK